MSKFGHCQGTKRERPHSQDWYAAIESETIRTLEAEPPAVPAETETSPTPGQLRKARMELTLRTPHRPTGPQQPAFVDAPTWTQTELF